MPPEKLLPQISSRKAEPMHSLAVGTLHPSERIIVQFVGSAVGTLNDMAERRRQTPAETVTDALALDRWFTDVLGHHGTIIIEEGKERNKTIQRVLDYY